MTLTVGNRRWGGRRAGRRQRRGRRGTRGGSRRRRRSRGGTWRRHDDCGGGRVARALDPVGGRAQHGNPEQDSCARRSEDGIGDVVSTPEDPEPSRRDQEREEETPPVALVRVLRPVVVETDGCELVDRIHRGSHRLENELGCGCRRLRNHGLRVSRRDGGHVRRHRRRDFLRHGRHDFLPHRRHDALRGRRSTAASADPRHAHRSRRLGNGVVRRKEVHSRAV